jgi:hypothetical protein
MEFAHEVASRGLVEDCAKMRCSKTETQKEVKCGLML